MRRSAAEARAVAGLALLVTLVSSAWTRATATPFVFETADAAGYAGFELSLALDGQDRPHVAYYEFNSHNLRYATKVGNTWVTTSVDTTGDVGQYPSIALDAAGNPHISYRDFTNGDLKYASKTGATWTIEVADNGAAEGAYSSLALDAAGNPRIAYLAVTGIDLRYASKTGGVWTVEIVDGAATAVGYYASLALDAAGRPHISYLDNTTDDLRYAFKNAGVWTSEIVDAAGFASWTSIGVDDQGNPRIAYYDSTPDDLKYAAKSAGVWTLETVDATGIVGNYCSLRINAAGNPRIAYASGLSDDDLKYAARSASTWAVETVDANGDAGYYSSLALDSQGNPRIAYLDASNGDLKYADSAVHVVTPAGGETWPVGSLRDVVWSGSGTVSILVSTDGGLTEDTLVESVESSPVTVRVPHVPSRFARIGIRRASPLSTAFSDTLLTIQTSIALLGFTAEPLGGSTPGVALAWSTDPGPQDLSGYEVERAASGSDAWRLVAPLTRETTFSDADGGAGSRYRLTAVNGLGERYVLGEAVVAPQSVIAAWPLPYRGGVMSVSFATASALGGGRARGALALYDVSGRLVRTLASGDFVAGRQLATWDGRDAGGRSVANGIYFLRSISGGQDASLKVVVAR
ncbi:MAG: FlgD immunoglobulin-like domain containing protein [bacterium]